MKHFESIRHLAHDLNPFSTNIRYPENYYPMLHEDIADQSIIYATEILSFVKDKIEASSNHSSQKKEKQIHY